MSSLAAVLICLAMLCIMLIADRKIKGKKSVVVKIASFLFFSLILLSIIYFYGLTMIESFGVNLKSFGKIRSFVVSRIIAFAMMALLVLFVFFKATYIVIKLILSKKENEKKAKNVDFGTISFDIDTVPDNFNNKSVNYFLCFNKLEEIKTIL